jgi:hypothetical protein
MNLQHNTPKDVPKISKREIMINIHAYGHNHAHYITVKSTLPYKAFDHKSFESRGIKKPLQFMEVIAMMEIAFGISNLGGLNKQLLCNPCFIGDEYSYTKDSMKKNSNLPSDESLEGSGSAQQQVHSNSDSSDGSYEGDGGVRTAESIQSHNNTEHPKYNNNSEQPEQEINKTINESEKKRALPSVTQTRMNLQSKKNGMTLRKNRPQDGGALCVNAPPRCKFECMKHAPEPNKHSLELKVKVCVKMWNCVPGNAINTVCALGHQELFTLNQNPDSILTKAIMPTAQMIRYTLPEVVHALKNHGYSTALT